MRRYDEKRKRDGKCPSFIFFREREEERETINVGILLNLFQRILEQLLASELSSDKTSKFHDTLR